MFRLAEDYLLVPKIIGRVVEIPAVVTLVAVLLGALIAIPVAAAIQTAHTRAAVRQTGQGLSGKLRRSSNAGLLKIDPAGLGRRAMGIRTSAAAAAATGRWERP